MGNKDKNLFYKDLEEPVSRSFEYKKVVKPLLERKRRARINKSLDELKELMMLLSGEDGETASRLEKADILEVTVKYMRSLKESGCLALTPNVTYSQRFRGGFSSCAAEVSRFLASPTSGVDSHVFNGVMSQVAKTSMAVESLPPNVLAILAEQSRINLQHQHQSLSLISDPTRCEERPMEFSATPLDLSCPTNTNTDGSWRPWW